MFRSNINTEENVNDYEEDTLKFQDYLHVLSSRDKGFQYRLAIGIDGNVNGVVWMTASMRSNMERFGSYICVDAMMRELNTLNWPYFAISLNNELGRVCVGCEALLFSEKSEAYSFMINACFEMCPGRKKEDVMIASGDGFFSQETLNQWGLINAKFIADHWHLFDSIFKKRFLNQGHYKMIEDNLRRMVDSNNEEQFNIAYRNCKRQLLNLPVRNGASEKALETIAKEKEFYASFMTRKLPGNKYRRGSVTAEQNHASVRASVYGDKDTNDYMEHMHVMIRDLFSRQKKHINDFNKLLFGLTNNKNNYLEQLNQNSSSLSYTITKEALLSLNYNSFLLFENELKQSYNYTATINSDNGGDFVHIQRRNCLAPARIFRDTNQRCNCEFRVSYLLMCRHEICMERKFNIEKCDIQHHYREQVTLSYNIKPQIEYFHRENKTIMTTLLQTMEESESGCIIEHSGNQRTQNNEEFNNEEDNNCNFEMDDNVGNDDIEDEINDDSDTRHLNIKSFLPQKSIKNINNEIFNYYQKASVENKEAMSAMLILVRDFLKTRGNTKQCTKISTDNNIQRIQLQNIVQCYNSAFMEGNNAFDNSKMIIPNQQSLMKKHKKRIQPTHEIQRRKAKKRITNKATCSFCGYEGHQTSTCPTHSLK